MSKDCSECEMPPQRSLRRGLCEACYLRAYRSDTLQDHPLQCHPSQDTADRYDALLSKHPSLTIKQASEMLDVKYSTLRVALSRHRRRISA